MWVAQPPHRPFPSLQPICPVYRDAPNSRLHTRAGLSDHCSGGTFAASRMARSQARLRVEKLGGGLLDSPSGLTSESCGPLAFSVSSQHVHRFNSGKQSSVSQWAMGISDSREKRWLGIAAFLAPTFTCPALFASYDKSVLDSYFVASCSWGAGYWMVLPL